MFIFPSLTQAPPPPRRGARHAGSAEQCRRQGESDADEREHLVRPQERADGAEQHFQCLAHDGAAAGQQRRDREASLGRASLRLVRREDHGLARSTHELDEDFVGAHRTGEAQFDQKYGINKSAVPKVGQGVTISTEFDFIFNVIG